MRLDLPDGSGWLELAEVNSLTTDHQDEYWDVREEMFERKRAALPPPGPDPANPAVMAPPPDVRLTRREANDMYSLAASWVVSGSSFAGVAPWGPESRKAMGLPMWNLLRSAMDDKGYTDALLGNAPKETTEASTPSGNTSQGAAPAPPEPVPAPSATQPA